MKKIAMILAGLATAAAAMAATTPLYPGGDDALKAYIESNLKYPESARANGIEGTVDVAFTVKADGTIGAIKIVRMIDPDLEAEAIRLVKSMPAWIPGEENGKPVDAPAQVEIPFSITE